MIDQDTFARETLRPDREARLAERRRAESDARALLDEKAGEMTEDDVRTLFRHFNRDFGRGRPVAGRFSPGFGGQAANLLVGDLEAFNTWTRRIWRGDDDQALEAFGELLRGRDALRGAGSSYPSMLMYLRNSRRWAYWSPITDRGLRQLEPGASHRRPDRANAVADYEQFSQHATALMETLEIEAEELDFVLAAAGRESPTRSADRPDRRTWWVNQGKTFKQERAGGYLWAPVRSGRGELQHHKNVMELRPGDLVISYAGRILSLSFVAEESRRSPRPAALPSKPWEKDGYMGVVQYHDLDQPIALSEIPPQWRTPQHGPFDKRGEVKVVYLEPVSEEFADWFHEHFADRLPDLRSPNVWLFQANPRYYDLAQHLAEARPGSEDTFSVSRYAAEMRPGDVAVLYQSGDSAGVYGLGTLLTKPGSEHRNDDWDTETHPEHDLGVRYRYTTILDAPITRDRLLDHPVLKDLEVLRMPRGTNFRVTPEQWRALESLMLLPRNGPIQALSPALEELHHELRRKKQVILQGPPGVGKTFRARQYIDWVTAGKREAARLTTHLAAIPDEDRTPEAIAERVLDSATLVVWDIVQFHPSYTYEDFIRGLVARPAEGGGVTFEAQNKVAGWIAAVAEALQGRHEDALALLIIDEINRGDVSKVFGELIYALEYRDEPVASPYAIAGNNQVVIPSNLLLIGTMNTADRSIALVDYALRRRFVFLDVRPDRMVISEHDGFAGELDQQAALWLFDQVASLFASAGELEDLQVGHSYFLPLDRVENPASGCELLARRFAYETYPLLLEYEAEDRFQSQELTGLLERLRLPTDRRSPQGQIAHELAVHLKTEPWHP